MIIIHIGMPKTGTTSIQYTMHASAKMLRDHHITYPCQYLNSPLDCGHHGLAQNLLREPFGEYTNEFIDYLNKENKNGNNVIISSEVFTNGLSGELRENFFSSLKRIAGVDEVCVIVFTRRFDSFIDSSFKLSIKNGATQTTDILEYANERLPWFEQVLTSLAELDTCSFISSLRIIPYKDGIDSPARLMSELLIPPLLTRSIGKSEYNNITPGLKQIALLGFHFDRLIAEIPGLGRDVVLANLSDDHLRIPGDTLNYSLLSRRDRVRLHNYAINISHSVFRKGYYDCFCTDPLSLDRVNFYEFNKDLISQDEVSSFIERYLAKFHSFNLTPRS